MKKACFNSVYPLDLVNLRNIERFTTHAISPLGMQNRAKTYLIAAIFAVLVSIVTSFVSIFLNNFPERGTLLQKNGQILGGDFVTFYVAGKIFIENRDALYDLALQRNIREQFLIEQGVSHYPELPFVYPILVAALFSLYSKLSFIPAFFAWSLTCFLVSSSIFFAVLKELGLLSIRRIPFVILAMLGFAPYGLNTIIGGHLSAFGLAIFSGVFLALHRRCWGLAGFLLSFSYYKPPIFLFALVSLILSQPFQFTLGFLIGAVFLIGLSLFLGGVSGLVAYVTTASRYLYGQELLPGFQLPPNQGAGIFGALVQLFPSVMYAAIALGIIFLILLGIIVSVSHRSKLGANPSILYALVCATSVGLSVQCIRYDLAMLMVPFAIILTTLPSLNKYYRAALIFVMGAFYSEFCFRDIHISNGSFNLSSALFVPLIFLLGLIAMGCGFFLRKEEKNA